MNIVERAHGPNGRIWTEGRPIRSRRGRPLLPHIDHGDAPDGALAWIEASRHEFSSIASFGCVEKSLLAVGAPPELVERAKQAADDERHHAKICLDVARRIGAPDARMVTDVSDLARFRRRPDDLARTARSALLDGVLDEGFAAGRLRRTARWCPELSATLLRLADDEARHAEFGADIVRWCVSVRPWLVNDLALALDETGSVRPRSVDLERVAADERSTYGLCRDEDADAAWIDALGDARELVATVRSTAS